MQISAPKSTEKALEKLLDKMYISNVSKRLRNSINQMTLIEKDGFGSYYKMQRYDNKQSEAR